MRSIKNMKGGVGCSSYRKTKVPKCNDQTDCVWDSGKCKKKGKVKATSSSKPKKTSAKKKVTKSNSLKKRATIPKTLPKFNKFITINNITAPLVFIGNYNKKDKSTTIKGYSELNKKSLILFSANKGNYGAWKPTRNIGGGQAQGVHLNIEWAKRTYGILAGPTNILNDAKKIIIKSLNEAWDYFNKNRDKYSYIAHPGTIENMGYYGGIWSKLLSYDERKILNKYIVDYLNGVHD